VVLARLITCRLARGSQGQTFQEHVELAFLLAMNQPGDGKIQPDGDCDLLSLET